MQHGWLSLETHAWVPMPLCSQGSGKAQASVTAHKPSYSSRSVARFQESCPIFFSWVVARRVFVLAGGPFFARADVLLFRFLWVQARSTAATRASTSGPLSGVSFMRHTPFLHAVFSGRRLVKR